MVEIGKESLSPAEMADIMEARNRSESGESVPPQGLFLTRIVYPPDIFVEKWTPPTVQGFF